jgi:hypothetical protein
VIIGSVLIMLVSTTPAQGSVVLTINTIRAWDGSSYVHAFGTPETATYGQTITAPSNTPRLRSFRFVVRLDATVKFRGYVYQWDPLAQRAKGVARWSSLTGQTSGYTWQTVTFDTGGLILAAGKQYVLFLSVSGLKQNAAPDEGQFAQPQDRDLYHQGAFVYFNNSSIAQWTTQTWDGGNGDFLGVGGDLAFKVVLTD